MRLCLSSLTPAGAFLRRPALFTCRSLMKFVSRPRFDARLQSSDIHDKSCQIRLAVRIIDNGNDAETAFKQVNGQQEPAVKAGSSDICAWRSNVVKPYKRKDIGLRRHRTIQGKGSDLKSAPKFRNINSRDSLSHWLDLEHPVDRNEYWLSIRDCFSIEESSPNSSFPFILLHHLNRSEHPNVSSVTARLVRKC